MPPVLVSIAVTPDPAGCTDEGQVQLTATGTYDDASTADITAMVGWHSTDQDIVVMGGTVSHPGLALGVAPGTATVEAIYPPPYIYLV